MVHKKIIWLLLLLLLYFLLSPVTPLLSPLPLSSTNSSPRFTHASSFRLQHFPQLCDIPNTVACFIESVSCSFFIGQTAAVSARKLTSIELNAIEFNLI
jgi:hypothetical protein